MAPFSAAATIFPSVVATADTEEASPHELRCTGMVVRKSPDESQIFNPAQDPVTIRLSAVVATEETGSPTFNTACLSPLAFHVMPVPSSETVTARPSRVMATPLTAYGRVPGIAIGGHFVCPIRSTKPVGPLL